MIPKESRFKESEKENFLNNFDLRKKNTANGRMVRERRSSFFATSEKISQCFESSQSSPTSSGRTQVTNDDNETKLSAKKKAKESTKVPEKKTYETRSRSTSKSKGETKEKAPVLPKKAKVKTSTKRQRTNKNSPKKTPKTKRVAKKKVAVKRKAKRTPLSEPSPAKRLRRNEPTPDNGSQEQRQLLELSIVCCRLTESQINAQINRPVAILNESVNTVRQLNQPEELLNIDLSSDEDFMNELIEVNAIDHATDKNTDLLDRNQPTPDLYFDALSVEESPTIIGTVESEKDEQVLPRAKSNTPELEQAIPASDIIELPDGSSDISSDPKTCKPFDFD